MNLTGQRADQLTDTALRSEIELVGDLVAAASVSQGPLRQSEIDRLLGVVHHRRSSVRRRHVVNMSHRRMALRPAV